MDQVDQRTKRRVRLFVATVASALVLAILAALNVDPVAMVIVTTLDAAVPGGLALIDESRAERTVSESQRVQELARGSIHGDPWSLAGLGALTLVAVERVAMVVFALFYAGWVVVVAGLDSLTLDDVVVTMVVYALPVAVPMLVISAFVLSNYVAHRTPDHPSRAVAGSLVGAVAIDVVLLIAVSSSYDLPIDAGIAAKLYGLILVPEIIAAYLGIRWANRTSDSYLIARLFRRLKPPDQKALVDLAQGVIGEQHVIE